MNRGERNTPHAAASDTSSHLAAEMRRWSNLGHRVEGGVLAAASVSALLETLDVLSGGWVYVWPGLLVAAGLFLPLVIFGHGHETYEHMGGRAAMLQDPQQRQHLVMAAILLLAGSAEIVALAGGSPILHYIWPLGLAVVGVMFVIHTQRGTDEATLKAVRIHRILGSTIILAALARGIQHSLGATRGLWAYAWSVILLIVAFQLLIYREPEGTYGGGSHKL